MAANDNGGARGPAAGCPICLETVSGEAYLDQCFHMFCYHCILQWSEMLVARPQSTSSRLQCLKCPLCKSHYNSIIHDLSGAKFQRDCILTSHGSRHLRLEAHIQREAVYSKDSGTTEQNRSRYINFVPKPNRWLFCWVQRELQALMQEEDVETVAQHVVGVVETFGKRFGMQAGIPSGNQLIKAKGLDWHTTISTAVRPFIFELAEKFAEELGSFLDSGVDIAAYDTRHAQLTSSIYGSNYGKNRSTGRFPNKVPFKVIDLYDTDIDDNQCNLMVRSPGIEASICSSDESLSDIRHQNLDRETVGQEHKHSQRETAHYINNRPSDPSDSSYEGLQSGFWRRQKPESSNRMIHSQSLRDQDTLVKNCVPRDQHREIQRTLGKRTTNKFNMTARKHCDSSKDSDNSRGKQNRKVSKKRKRRQHGKRSSSHRENHRGTEMTNGHSSMGVSDD